MPKAAAHYNLLNSSVNFFVNSIFYSLPSQKPVPKELHTA
jgi:hypothetical protein